MKILSSNNYITKLTNTQFNKTNTIKTSNISFDYISFSSKTTKTPMWDDFCKKIHKTFPNKTPEEVAQEAITKQENILGEGVKKIVYSIDGIEDYVVAEYKKRERNNESALVPVEDPFSGYNFSQEIATNNAHLGIMKKINGNVHSIDNWTSKYQGLVYRNEPITQEDSKLFLEKLKEIEALPLDSFIDFAKQVRYLTDRRIKIDLFNPNNIIVDTSAKKISHFDLFEKPEMFHPLGRELNGTQDMINILADALLHGEYYKALDETERQSLVEITKSIAKKCKLAGDIVGLSSDPNIAYKTYEFLQDKLHKKDGRNTKYLELYRNFQDLYGIN